MNAICERWLAQISETSVCIRASPGNDPADSDNQLYTFVLYSVRQDVVHEQMLEPWRRPVQGLLLFGYGIAFSFFTFT